MTFRTHCVLLILLILVAQTSPASIYPDTWTYSRIQTLEAAIQAYRDDTGNYPLKDQVLHELSQEPEKASNWQGPYIPGQGSLVDGWGEDLIYRHPPAFGDRDFDLYSKGANQQDDRGEADDITNWSGVPRIYGQHRNLEFAADTLLVLIFPWALFW